MRRDFASAADVARLQLRSQSLTGARRVGDAASTEADFAGGRSAGHVDGERKTMAVADRHDSAAFARRVGRISSSPFFASAKVASRKPSVTFQLAAELQILAD